MGGEHHRRARAVSDPGEHTRNAATYYDPNQIQMQLTFKSVQRRPEPVRRGLGLRGRREIDHRQRADRRLSSDFSQGAWVSFPIRSRPAGR